MFFSILIALIISLVYYIGLILSIQLDLMLEYLKNLFYRHIYCAVLLLFKTHFYLVNREGTSPYTRCSFPYHIKYFRIMKTVLILVPGNILICSPFS